MSNPGLLHRTRTLATLCVTVSILGACATGSGTVAPDATAPAPASVGECDVSTKPGTVQVEITEFEFIPAEVTASVGETITFTNTGSRPHTATLHDNSCDVDLDPGKAGGLVFDGPGLYAFHCSIHECMTGLIDIR